MLPVVREELRKADTSCRRLLKRDRKLLVREETQMNEQERHRLQGVLQLSQTLRTVREYRASLQAVWGLTTASHDNLLAALQEWCAQAEASGIQALQDFAQSLRGYTLQPA